MDIQAKQISAPKRNTRLKSPHRLAMGRNILPARAYPLRCANGPTQFRHPELVSG